MSDNNASHLWSSRNQTLTRGETEEEWKFKMSHNQMRHRKRSVHVWSVFFAKKIFLFPHCLVGNGYCTIPLQIKYGLFYHCNLKAARKEWTSLSRQSVPLPRSSRARKAWKSLLRAPLAAPLTRDLGDPVSRSWSEWMAPAMVVVVGKTRERPMIQIKAGLRRDQTWTRSE